MKKLDFEMDDVLLATVFPEHLIQSRIELCRILIEALRTALYQAPSPNGNALPNRITIYVDKMCRIFFFKGRMKYYSIAIPFQVSNPLEFRFNEVVVDSVLFSNILSILNESEFDGPTLGLGDIDALILFQEDVDSKVLNDIIYKLMTYDMGYVRYDDDEKGFEEAKKAGHSKRHPRHHLDTHLSTESTFKKGLNGSLSPEKFIEILDNKVDRWTLIKP
ncbi:MAG: hypothetical protein LIP03_00590 [Bacteroidales bacterium]|nr:hypothetical protein [Bacteroidales bacterium]